MRHRLKLFDGSDSLFRTHYELVNRADHAVWLTEFTPARVDHLGFVNRLLQTFCELDICCVLVNAYRPILRVSSVCFLRAVMWYVYCKLPEETPPS